MKKSKHVFPRILHVVCLFFAITIFTLWGQKAEAIDFSFKNRIPNNQLKSCTYPSVWGKDIAAGRFVPVFGGAGYCDRETGLVWEAAPGDTDTQSGEGFIDEADRTSFNNARAHCAWKAVGGKKGWRLPSFHELASLVDPNNVNVPGGPPALPPDHPFSDIQASGYWTATEDTFEFIITLFKDEPPEGKQMGGGSYNRAWIVYFNTGAVATGDKLDQNYVWCVRGGGPISTY